MNEALGSYAIIETSDREAAAVAIAATWPGGAHEVRPVMEE